MVGNRGASTIFRSGIAILKHFVDGSRTFVVRTKAETFLRIDMDLSSLSTRTKRIKSTPPNLD